MRETVEALGLVPVKVSTTSPCTGSKKLDTWMDSRGRTKVRISVRKRTLIMCSGDQRARRRHMMKDMKLSEVVQSHGSKGCCYRATPTAEQSSFQKRQHLAPSGASKSTTEWRKPP